MKSAATAKRPRAKANKKRSVAKSETQSTWLDSWLDDVASGSATMSQRVLTSIEAHGGLDKAVAAARKRGVHLVLLTDDKGTALVAASQKPFETLC